MDSPGFRYTVSKNPFNPRAVLRLVSTGLPRVGPSKTSRVVLPFNMLLDQYPSENFSRGRLWNLVDGLYLSYLLLWGHVLGDR